MSDIKLFRIASGSVTELAGSSVALGLDENNCPMIIEYKRSLNENVVIHGLFYFDWLLDHRAEFVRHGEGPRAPDPRSGRLDGSAPRTGSAIRQRTEVAADEGKRKPQARPSCIKVDLER